MKQALLLLILFLSLNVFSQDENVRIVSTDSTATSNTEGLCNIERAIIRYGFVLDQKGNKKQWRAYIRSKHFQQKEVVIDGQTVKERKYIAENTHVEKLAFTINQYKTFYTNRSAILDGKTEDEQMLIILKFLTRNAGNDGKGWQGMDNWVDDTNDYVVVTEFTGP